MSLDQPYPTSVCHGCRWLVLAASKTSTFLRCTRPGWPKYPAQPLPRCHGREPLPPSPGTGADRARG